MKEWDDIPMFLTASVGVKKASTGYFTMNFSKMVVFQDHQNLFILSKAQKWKQQSESHLSFGLGSITPISKL